MNYRQRFGIIAHYSTSNYGNHLVNYASRSILRECGFETDLVVVEGRQEARYAPLKRLPRKLARLGVRGLVSRAVGRLNRMGSPSSITDSAAASMKRRRERFADFSKTYLNPVFVDRRAVSTLHGAYARIAIGSDQIWNYDYGVGGTLFANFTSQSEVVTLSPSVGHESLPSEWVGSYKRWLSGFTEVGTREIEWTKSVGTSKQTPRFTLLVDPTLMYDKDFWGNIAKPYPEARGKALLYHLGSLLPDHEEYVRKLTKTHSLGVLHVSDTVAGAAWETNASDFLGMIQEASCVITDSYHGAIFAFLFNKPLVLLERHGFAGAMNTRTRTLTERLRLTKRYVNELSPTEALSHDYAEGFELLETYREDFWAYLGRNGVNRIGTSTAFQSNTHN